MSPIVADIRDFDEMCFVSHKSKSKDAMYLQCKHIFSFRMKVILIIRKKIDPCKTWVKISKVMPQPNSPFPGKGREASQQKSKSFK